MNKLQQRLKERIDKDYRDYIALLEQESKKHLINQSYQIATVLNFYNALDYYLEALDGELDNDEFPISNSKIKALLSYPKNILSYFFTCWEDYIHPERYDFWYNYDTVMVIIRESIKELT